MNTVDGTVHMRWNCSGVLDHEAPTLSTSPVQNWSTNTCLLMDDGSNFKQFYETEVRAPCQAIFNLCDASGSKTLSLGNKENVKNVE